MSNGRKEYTLSIIRVVSQRLKHIDEEITSIGVALSHDLITPAQATEMTEQIAPGCVDVVALSILQGAVDDASRA
jgi:hypothetical protein